MSSQESCAPPQSQGTSNRRRRRSAPPPPRLSWPGSTQSTLTQPSSSKRSKSSASRRKSKRQRVLFNDKGHNDDDDWLLWVDQYAPSNRKELCVAPKKIQEVATWLEEGREKLLILVGRPGIGKSAMIRVLANETHSEILEWNDSYSTWSSHVESLSPLNSFAQFLQQSGAGFASLNLQQSTSSSQVVVFQERMILLEELPNLANAESQDKFRQLLTNHVQTTQIKTIWIYSDGTEGTSKAQDLERCIDPNVLHSCCKIMQINPVTKSQIKKALERVAKAEKFIVQKDFCERMHVQSGGDIRYAIMSLQFDQAGRSNRKSSEDPEHPRDTKWTAFHALGKILYAKREEASTGSGERPPLKFDPEQVLEHCDLDLGNALTYLGFHGADFFTDIQELSTAFDLFSDASYLLEQTTNYNYQRRRYNNNHSNSTVACPIFPEGYVTSLAGRSIAHANRHPAPSKFRQLQAPKFYEIRRKRTDNANHLAQLQHRMSRLSLAGDLATTAKATSSSMPSFVMDRLPYLRAIAPDAVNAPLNQLHTSASEETNRFMDEEERIAAQKRLEKEQQEILEMDDIVEYDSSEEGDLAEPSQSKKQDSKPQQNRSTAVVPNGGSTNKATIDASENNENRPAKTTKPIKRIANPYSRKKASKSSSQQTTAINAAPSRISEPEFCWSRTQVKSEPSATSAQHPPQPPVETKPKITRKVVLMDV